ncbi:MAG: hypothetical protein JXR49_11360 [Acidobacteria bacterium]|nr:hypothetical protein [Acidobacteriota bacterium]
MNVKLLIKGLIKSLATSILLMGPGFVLILIGLSFPGMVLLFVGSFWMMARTYRRPWRLTRLSCFIPPLVALISYAMQLSLFAVKELPWPAIALAVGAGILLGWWRGNSHRVYAESGMLFAKRTLGYLICWILGYGFTQSLATAASSVLLIHAGLVTGAFTTTLLVMVSVILLRKRNSMPVVSLGHNAAGVFFAGLCIAWSLLMLPSVSAFQQSRVAAELRAAINGGDAEEIFAAALMSGLNEDLGLTRLQRAADQSDAKGLNSFLGIQLDTSQFVARSGSDRIKIIFNVGEAETPLGRYMLTAFGPPVLDKIRDWVLDPEGWDENVRFSSDMKFRPVRIGEYAMVLSGSNDRISLANGILLCNGRVVLIEMDIYRGNQAARVDRMLLNTLSFMAGSYDSGPGAFTPDKDGTAAVSIATLLMLASAGIALNLVQSVAAASGLVLKTTVESASQAVADTAVSHPASDTDPLPLIDPRDGQQLETDGDRVYWDDDAGWIDRQTAQQWIDEIKRERARRDAEVEQRWDEIQQSRDDYYDRQRADLQRNGYVWDADSQMWVDRDGDDYPMALLHNVYGALDFIDDNIDRLTPEMQKRVRKQLDRIDTSDPYNISPEDLERLGKLTGAVRDLRIGQDESAAAAKMHTDIDRAETNAFIANFGMGVVRFGISRLDPTQGVLTGAAFGYFTAPEGSGVTHAIIGGAATYIDITASQMAPSNILWNVSTGSGIAATEMALYGGNWEDIKRSALIGGGMNGLFALGQKPGVRSWLDDTDLRIRKHWQSVVGGGADRPLNRGVDGGIAAKTESRSGVPSPPGPYADATVRSTPSATAGDDGVTARSTPPSGAPDPDSVGIKVRPPGSAAGEPVKPNLNTPEGRAAWDAMHGGPREGKLPTGLDDPTPWIPEDIRNHKGAHWLRDTDLRIREHWQSVGAGRQDGAWEQFTNRVNHDIAGGKLELEHVDHYFNLMDKHLDPHSPGGGWKGHVSETSSTQTRAASWEPSPPRATPEYDFPGVTRSKDLADYADGGQTRMALAEERGQVSVEQARQFTSRGTAAVNEAVQKSTPQAMNRFEAETGVRVKRAYVGDSGSSAKDAPRSVSSDNDRTVHAEFDDADLMNYARNHFPKDRPEAGLAKAHAELIHTYARHQREGVDTYLRQRYDVGASDLGVDVYGGIAAPGPGAPNDLYGPAFTRVRQSVKGTVTVYNRDGSSYRTSGQALVDAEHLARHRYLRADHPMTGDDTLQRMTGTDYRSTAAQQIIKAHKIDPLDVNRPQVQQAAKSLERAAQASKGLGGPSMDSKLVKVAEDIRGQRRSIPEILTEAKMSREQFLAKAKDAILKLEGDS